MISDTPATSGYAGHRILEAMRSAPQYAEAIYRQARSVYPQETGIILDFGAGDGIFVEKFRRDGIAVDCVEPDEKNQIALRRLSQTVVGDIGLLDSERYTFIYTINVLEHLTELDHYLAELYRVLRRDGILFVFVPAFNGLWTSLDDEVGHVQRFSRRTLTASLMRARFTVTSSRYFDSAGFPAALAIRLLERFHTFNYRPESVGFYDKMILPFSLLGDYLLKRVLGKNVIAVAIKN